MEINKKFATARKVSGFFTRVEKKKKENDLCIREREISLCSDNGCSTMHPEGAILLAGSKQSQTNVVLVINMAILQVQRAAPLDISLTISLKRNTGNDIDEMFP